MSVFIPFLKPILSNFAYSIFTFCFSLLQTDVGVVVVILEVILKAVRLVVLVVITVVRRSSCGYL